VRWTFKTVSAVGCVSIIAEVQILAAKVAGRRAGVRLATQLERRARLTEWLPGHGLMRSRCAWEARALAARRLTPTGRAVIAGGGVIARGVAAGGAR